MGQRERGKPRFSRLDRKGRKRRGREGGRGEEGKKWKTSAQRASERARILVCRYGILRTAPTILVNHWSRRPDFMRPGAEIPIIHPRTWNIPISSWSRSDWTRCKFSGNTSVRARARITFFLSLFFFFVSFFMSRLTADSFFNFRSRVTDSIECAQEYSMIARTRSLANTLSRYKFIADLILQIWREIDKYSF